jgi:hypothetical protein
VDDLVRSSLAGRGEWAGDDVNKRLYGHFATPPQNKTLALPTFMILHIRGISSLSLA